jgi:hypothetical protein
VIRTKIDDEVSPFTVRLGDLGFHNILVDVPDNAVTYTNTLHLADSIGVDVEVTAGLDIVNREVFWILQSIDPNTGLAPYNPFSGLLAVNDSLGNGEGFVSYSILVANTAVTPDSISATAEIVFDINDPIITNTWVNQLDATNPVSQLVLDSANYNTLHLSIEGSDLHSGIQLYDIYKSENGGPYMLLEANYTDSTYQFVGTYGIEYRFFSIATDRVGNVEAMKSPAEVTMMVTCVGDFNNDGVIAVGDLLLFMANYGCPSNCGIYDLTGDDTVSIGDLLVFMASYGTTCP